MPGQFLNYDLESELGRGPFSVVYLATDKRTHKKVTLKKLLDGDIAPNKYKILAGKLLGAAQITQRLSHPNIVSVIEIVAAEETGEPFVVSDYVDGQSLRELLLASSGKISSEEFRGILNPVCEALSYSHSLNVVHGNLKPENILIKKDGSVLVRDFGAATQSKLLDSELEREPGYMRTLLYASPEQLQPAELFEFRSDVFSLGVLSYECLSGHVPFHAEGVAAMVIKVIAVEPKPLHQLEQTISANTAQVIQRALKKQARDRQYSVSEFARDFGDSLSQGSVDGVASDNDRGLFGALQADTPSQSTDDQQQLKEGSPERQTMVSPEIPTGRSRPPRQGVFSAGGSTSSAQAKIIEPVQSVPPHTGTASVATQIQETVQAVDSGRAAETASAAGPSIDIESARKAYEEASEPQAPANGFFSGTRTSASPYKKSQAEVSQSLQPGLPLELSKHQEQAVQAPSVAANYNVQARQIAIIGRKGQDKGAFLEPNAVCARGGKVLVADSSLNKVLMFHRDGRYLGDLQPRRDIKGSRTEGGRVTNPSGIAIDPQGQIYVTDSSDHFIRVYDSQGKYVKEFINIYGKGGGLQGVACDANGLVYVTDGDNGCVHVLKPDLGNWVVRIGSKGDADGQVKIPSGLVTDNDGNVYVVDYATARVSVFFKNGAFIRSFGGKGTINGVFNVPRGITLERSGKILIADSLNHRLQIFDPQGNWIYTIGSRGAEAGKFMGPAGMSVDPETNCLYVADRGNCRVQVFELRIT
jgi:serine/threonine protein kinase/sugar lactone lactonase YvrE